MKNNFDLSIGHVGKLYAGRSDVATVVNGGTSVMNYYAPKVAGAMIKRPGFRLIAPYHFGRFHVFAVGSGVIFGHPGSGMYAVNGIRIVVDKDLKTTLKTGDLVVIDGEFSVNQYVYITDGNPTYLPGFDKHTDIPKQAHVATAVTLTQATENLQYEEFLGRLNVHSGDRTHVLNLINKENLKPFDKGCLHGQEFRFLPDETITDKISFYPATHPEGVPFSDLATKESEYTASTRFQQRNILAIYHPHLGYGEILISSIASSTSTSVVDGLFGKWYQYRVAAPGVTINDAVDAEKSNMVLRDAQIIQTDILRYNNFFYSKSSTLQWRWTSFVRMFSCTGTAITAGGQLQLHHGTGRVTMLGAIDDLMFLGTEYKIMYTQSLLTKPITRTIHPKGAAEVSPLNIGNNLIYVDANGVTLMYISKPPEAAPIVQVAPIISDFFLRHGGIKKIQALSWSTTAIIALTHCGYLAYIRPTGDNWALFPWSIHNSYVNDIAVLASLGQPDLLYAAIDVKGENWLCCADEVQFAADPVYATNIDYSLALRNHLKQVHTATKFSAIVDLQVTRKLKKTQALYKTKAMTTTDEFYDNDQTGSVHLGNVIINQRNVKDGKNSAASLDGPYYASISFDTTRYNKDFSFSIEDVFHEDPVIVMDSECTGAEHVKEINVHANSFSFGVPITAYWEGMPGTLQNQSYNDLSVLADKFLTWSDVLDTSTQKTQYIFPGQIGISLAWQNIPAKSNTASSASRVMFFHTWAETVMICAIKY